MTPVYADLKLLAVFASCLILFAWIAPRVYIRHRLRKVDGIRASVVADNLFYALYWLWGAAREHMNDNLLQYFNSTYESASPQCPNLVELIVGRRRLLMTREPEHIKTILTSKFTQFGKGPTFHAPWSPFLGDSIFTTDGQLWQNSRNLIRPMFMRERFRDVKIFHHWADYLISKIPRPGQTVDICNLFYRMTLDVTTDFLLGESVGSLDNPYSHFSKAFAEVQHVQMLITILFPVRWLIPRKKYLEGIKILEQFIDPYIEAALKLNKQQLEDLSRFDREFTFLHSIVLSSRDRKVIRDQIMAVLIAGRDTTAATLSWTIFELSKYPEQWTKLRQQVLDRLGATSRPTYKDVKNMPRVVHALNETLRLYPAVPYNLRECFENTTLPGQHGQPDVAVLSGDIVVYSTLAMQRRKDLYPPTSDEFADPALYCPDRWEHWVPKPWQYVPFNGGPRICIGQNFALMEMAVTLVRLLQKYERVEYRGDWAAQRLRADIVGCPTEGVPVALYEANDGEKQMPTQIGESK